MTLEELKYKKELNGSEQLTNDEIEILLDIEEENHRKGNFDRVYPELPLLASYEKFFEVKRYQNSLVSAYLQASREIQVSLTKICP